MIATTSPGRRRTILNTKKETSSRVGIRSKTRLKIYQRSMEIFL